MDCDYCLEEAKAPQVLDCSHSLCEECVLDHMDNNNHYPVCEDSSVVNIETVDVMSSQHHDDMSTNYVDNSSNELKSSLPEQQSLKTNTIIDSSNKYVSDEHYGEHHRCSSTPPSSMSSMSSVLAKQHGINKHNPCPVPHNTPSCSPLCLSPCLPSCLPQCLSTCSSINPNVNEFNNSNGNIDMNMFPRNIRTLSKEDKSHRRHVSGSCSCRRVSVADEDDDDDM